MLALLKRLSNIPFYIVVLAIVVLIAVLGYQYYITERAISRAKQPGGMAVLGSPGAAVTVVEYVDYNCPPCASASDAIMQVLKTRDNVRVIVRPLPMLGEESKNVARLAIAAAGQDKFSAYHRALMDKIAELGRGEDSNRLDRIQALKTARAAGIDTRTLKSAAESKRVRQILARNVETADSLDIRMVPTFIIGSRLYTPVDTTPGPDDFHRMLDVVQSAS